MQGNFDIPYLGSEYSEDEAEEEEEEKPQKVETYEDYITKYRAQAPTKKEYAKEEKRFSPAESEEEAEGEEDEKDTKDESEEEEEEESEEEEEQPRVFGASLQKCQYLCNIVCDSRCNRCLSKLFPDCLTEQDSLSSKTTLCSLNLSKYKDSVSATKKTQHFSTTKLCLLMLFREVITVCY